MKKLTIIFIGLFLLSGINQFIYPSVQSDEVVKEIVKIKYMYAHEARNVLMPYMSKIGKIRAIDRENRLVIEDIPEVMAKLLVILKEIDVRPADLQFTCELILGSLIPGEKEVIDKDLRSDPVIKELKSLLKYKSFKLLDSSVIKVQDTERSSQRLGGGGKSFRLSLYPRHIKEEKDEILQVELRLSEYMGITPEGKERTLTLIDTTLTIKNGERTVVGVSKLDGGDKALILIISGLVIK